MTAEDAAGNIGPASNEAAATATADTTAPTAPFLLGSVTGNTANLDWTESTDDVGVLRYNVHRGTSAGFTPSVANRIAQPGHGLCRQRACDRDVLLQGDGRGRGRQRQRPLERDHCDDCRRDSADGADGLAATPSGSTINLSWTAATDNVAVVRYNVHRGTSAGFTPSPANRIAQPTGTAHADTGLNPGTYFYKVTAEDAAGNVGPVSNTASATVADTTAPTAPSGLNAAGGAGQASLTWTAATDNVGVVRYNVHRATTAGFTPSAANRIAQPTGTSHTDTGLTAGSYFYKVTAEDAAGNVGAASNEASATVTAPPVTGLVAAYGFDAGSGTTAADQSGNGNTGTLANATWAGAGSGKFGNALSFNGTNATVNIPHSASLNLTTGMTLEAWVRPTALAGGDWNTVIFKERPGYYGWGIYANTGSNRPSGNVSPARTTTSAAALSSRSTPGHISPPRTTARPSSSMSTAPRRRPCPPPARSSAAPAYCGSAATRSGASTSTA